MSKPKGVVASKGYAIEKWNAFIHHVLRLLDDFITFAYGNFRLAGEDVTPNKSLSFSKVAYLELLKLCKDSKLNGIKHLLIN